MDEVRADLVLVGAGHAHVQVLRRWMMDPLAGVRLTLVVDRPEAVYSGMVPGWVAGDYSAHELTLDAVPLARRAGARVVLAAAESVDPGARRIALSGRPSLRYDVASLDVGATVRGLGLPGVAENALACRPISRLIDELDARIESLPARPRVLVVGSGVAGVELAFTLAARLRRSGREPLLEIAGESDQVMAGSAAAVRRRVGRQLAARGIRVRGGEPVAELKPGKARVGDTWLEADLVVWATGAAPHPFPSGPGLPLDSGGFLRVDPQLEVEGCPDLFAAGDCAALPFAPWVRKAGVWAVRAGPVLDANLRARLQGGPLRRFRPQRDFLTLIHMGDGRALGTKWGRSVSGGWVLRWKDRIDRRFVRRFQVLDADGSPSADFPSRESMGMEEMPCGGCAAKVAAPALGSALARLDPAPPDPRVRLGLEAPDDAAWLILPGGDQLLTSVDAFRAFSDDPWWVGRVAAVNALSDVHAKGGRPRFALAWVNVPEADPGRAEETLYQALAGVRTALDPLGVSLVGGHSTQGGELSVGLAVSGEPGAAVLRASGLRPGQQLLLSKPLGSGVLLAADMRGELPGVWLTPLLEMLARPGAEAARIASSCGAAACTDVSGFGLAGHLGELLRASRVSARLEAEALPVLGPARSLLRRGLRSTYHAQNATALLSADRAAVAPEDIELCFDPQTSGGLLFAVDSQRVEEALRALHEAGDRGAAHIGEVIPAHAEGPRIELCSGR